MALSDEWLQVGEEKSFYLQSSGRSVKVFHDELGTISWNKVIFQDKLQFLLKARINESKQNNFLPSSNEKNYKKILNIVRTLKPVVFHVKPTRKEDGAGFFFQPFDVIDEHTVKLNPLFDALFFCSIDTVKKVLNYEAKP